MIRTIIIMGAAAGLAACVPQGHPLLQEDCERIDAGGYLIFEDPTCPEFPRDEQRGGIGQVGPGGGGAVAPPPGGSPGPVRPDPGAPPSPPDIPEGEGDGGDHPQDPGPTDPPAGPPPAGDDDDDEDDHPGPPCVTNCGVGIGNGGPGNGTDNEGQNDE